MPIPNKKISKAALHVIGRLQEAGYQAYIVGGAVRDLMLDRPPKDYDVATSATPEEVKDVFKRRCRIIGRWHHLIHSWKRDLKDEFAAISATIYPSVQPDTLKPIFDTLRRKVEAF